MATGIAPKLPLARDSVDGCFVLIKDYLTLVKQNFKMLLFTSPGERTWDINYGIGIRQFLFRDNIIGNYSDLNGKIEQQVSLYLPFIEIENIEINPLEEENLIYIKISYKIVPLGKNDLLSLEIANISTVY